MARNYNFPPPKKVKPKRITAKGDPRPRSKKKATRKRRSK